VRTSVAVIGFFALALSAAPLPASAGSLEIGGRTLNCPNVSATFDDSLSIEGAYFPGRGLVFNKQLLERYPAGVAIFIFKHECAHKAGADEFTADCVAARAGRQQGWLTESGIERICKRLSGERESASHPAGSARCANIRRCFGSSK